MGRTPETSGTKGTRVEPIAGGATETKETGRSTTMCPTERRRTKTKRTGKSMAQTGPPGTRQTEDSEITRILRT
jgi:hypothetical protein